VDLVFEYQRVEFEWEGFGVKSFWKDTSLSLSLSMCVCVCGSIPQSPAERDSQLAATCRHLSSTSGLRSDLSVKKEEIF